MPLILCSTEPGFKAQVCATPPVSRKCLNLVGIRGRRKWCRPGPPHSPVAPLKHLWTLQRPAGVFLPSGRLVFLPYSSVLHDKFIMGIARRGVVCSPGRLPLAEGMIQKEDVWMVKHGESLGPMLAAWLSGIPECEECPERGAPPFLLYPSELAEMLRLLRIWASLNCYMLGMPTGWD